MFTLTSRYAFSYAKVEGEVCVQKWGTILVDNVPGSNAPKMTQSSLLSRVKYRKRQNLRTALKIAFIITYNIT